LNSTKAERWINFNRIKEDPYYRANAKWNRQFLTEENDTLNREFYYSHFRDTGPILYEFSKINGKLNGLAIGFHPNGRIYSVKYYLNDKLWEVISLADSSGECYDPGTLANGNGTSSFMSNDGHYLGYATYKNGVQDGEYYHISGFHGLALKGTLSYEPNCIKFRPAIRTKFINEVKDTVTITLDSTMFKEFFNKERYSQIKVLETIADSLIDQPRINPNLDEDFGAGSFPIGKWKRFFPEINKVYWEYEFDNCGNLLSEVHYNDNGSVQQRITKGNFKK
jgi:hypothetical protein